MGTGMDLTTLESLQVTISHTLATDEVHYHLQAWSVTLRSLPSTPYEVYIGTLTKDRGTLTIIILLHILEIVPLSQALT